MFAIMPDPSPPDPGVVAEAWRLAVRERLTTREIAARLDVSQTTVVNYVRKGRAAYAELHAEDEEAIRTDSTATLDDLATWLDEARKSCETPEQRVQVVHAYIAIEKRRSALHGADKPAKVQISTPRQAPAPMDGALIAALEALDARDATDERELRAGRPGII